MTISHAMISRSYARGCHLPRPTRPDDLHGIYCGLRVPKSADAVVRSCVLSVPMFDIDQTGAILGMIGSGRDVLRPTGRSAQVGSRPSLCRLWTVGRCQPTSAKPSQKLKFHTPYSRLVLNGYDSLQGRLRTDYSR